MFKALFAFALAISGAHAYADINAQACASISTAFGIYGQTPRSSTCNVTVTDGNGADIFKEALIDFAIYGKGNQFNDTMQVGSVALNVWKTPINILSGTIRCVLNPNYGWECLYQNQDKNSSCNVISGVTPVDKVNLAGYSPAEDCIGQQTVWAQLRRKPSFGSPIVLAKFDDAYTLVPTVVQIGLQDLILSGMTTLANDVIYPFAN
ncbi:MAG: hypothetical protein M3Q07_03135 [Pseudobdellovibrionaceae bacterium]|nr:hypothetical protein [Pseudobdellovibrionaceae bacterium]